MNYKIFLLTLLLLQSARAFAQSPWINNKGSFYSQVSLTYLSYGSVINEKVNTIEPAEFRTRDITTNLFLDYSINNKLALVVNLPYKAVQYNDQSLSSLGDPSIKLRFKILQNIPLSVNIGYTAPLSTREGILRTGYKQHASELGFSIGKGRKKSFTYGGLGYRNRANIPNQVLVEYEYGYRFSLANNSFYTIFHIDGMLNTSDIEDNDAEDANLFHNNGEFISPAIKLSYNALDNFWFNLAIHSAVFVRNFGASSTFTFGLAYKLEQ